MLRAPITKYYQTKVFQYMLVNHLINTVDVSLQYIILAIIACVSLLMTTPIGYTLRNV